MNERERLIELLEKAIRYADENYRGRPIDGKYCGLMADHLLANGVTVPPCKVGDMLYKPYCGKILEYKVIEFSFRVEGLQARTQSKQTGGLHPVWCASIGKTYFLHRHEAEAVLAALLKGGK